MLKDINWPKVIIYIGWFLILGVILVSACYDLKSTRSMIPL